MFACIIFASPILTVIIILILSWKVAHTLPLSSHVRNETSCEIRECKVISFRIISPQSRVASEFRGVQTYDRKQDTV